MQLLVTDEYEDKYGGAITTIKTLELYDGDKDNRKWPFLEKIDICKCHQRL